MYFVISVKYILKALVVVLVQTKQTKRPKTRSAKTPSKIPFSFSFDPCLTSSHTVTSLITSRAPTNQHKLASIANKAGI